MDDPKWTRKRQAEMLHGHHGIHLSPVLKWRVKVNDCVLMNCTCHGTLGWADRDMLPADVLQRSDLRLSRP